MAIVKGTNCFVSLTEAEAYFEDRLDVAAWEEANDDQRSKALVTASQVLDVREWTGIAVSDSQVLSFPRKGSFFDPRLGRDVCYTADIPTRIAQATYELAYHLLNNDGLLDDTGSVLDLQLGSIQLTHIQNASQIPPHVYRIIRPLLCNSGTNSWWRAN